MPQLLTPRHRFATEILLFEETETQAVFSPDARGYWNLEFPCLVFYTCSRECIKRTDEDISGGT